jgi:hypothetical protein
MTTIGLSPKVLRPAAVQAVALVVNLIASGEFSRTELAQVVALALTAVIGWWAPPGVVTAERKQKHGPGGPQRPDPMGRP